MEIKEFSEALKAHNDKGGMYQVHLNSNNLEGENNCISGVEFNDLYFTNCGTVKTVNDDILLLFGNENTKPIYQKDDGTNIYPMDISSGMTIEVKKIEAIDEVEDTDDWFSCPSTRIINLYMVSESNNMNENRNVISIGFME